jgi:hypothetical protein
VRYLGFSQRFCWRLTQYQQICTASLWKWTHHDPSKRRDLFARRHSVTLWKSWFFWNNHCTLNVDILWRWVDLLHRGHRENPMGGGVDIAGCFSLAAFCCIRLQNPLAYVSQTKGRAFSGSYHVVVATKSLVNRTARRLGECIVYCRSQWPRGLRRGSAAARLLGLWVRIPPVTWMSVSCKCCVLSGRGLCDGLVPRPEESYRLWCVWVWSWSPEQWGGLGPQGLSSHWKKTSVVRWRRGKYNISRKLFPRCKHRKTVSDTEMDKRTRGSMHFKVIFREKESNL